MTAVSCRICSGSGNYGFSKCVFCHGSGIDDASGIDRGGNSVPPVVIAVPQLAPVSGLGASDEPIDQRHRKIPRVGASDVASSTEALAQSSISELCPPQGLPASSCPADPVEAESTVLCTDSQLLGSYSSMAARPVIGDIVEISAAKSPNFRRHGVVIDMFQERSSSTWFTVFFSDSQAIKHYSADMLSPESMRQ